MSSQLPFRMGLSSYVYERTLINHKKIEASNSHTQKSKHPIFSSRSWECNKITATVKHHSSGKTQSFSQDSLMNTLGKYDLNDTGPCGHQQALMSLINPTCSIPPATLLTSQDNTAVSLGPQSLSQQHHSRASLQPCPCPHLLLLLSGVPGCFLALTHHLLLMDLIKSPLGMSCVGKGTARAGSPLVLVAWPWGSHCPMPLTDRLCHGER